MAFDPKSVPQVAMAFQNEDHAHEAQLLNIAVEALGAGDRSAATSALNELVQHTREHFAREDEAMRRTQFPPAEVHASEHVRVLDELQLYVDAFRSSGDAAPMLAYLTGPVLEWFADHIQSMDYVTARWLASHDKA